MTAVALKHAISGASVSVTLGATEVLHNVDVSFAAGRWTSIVGPNGAGKSTLLKALAGLIKHTGQTTLQGELMARLSGRERARRLSWLGQNEPGTDDLTAWDVTMLGRLPHQPWLAAPSQVDRDAVERALRSTQAWDWRDRSLGELSGGERQRVLLARALAVEADVMLMDEPLANLDPPHQADWLQLVRAQVSAGKTVVSVLHETSFALAADEMLVLAAGRVVHQGACADAATHRALESVFDGRIAIREVDGHWVSLPQGNHQQDKTHAD